MTKLRLSLLALAGSSVLFQASPHACAEVRAAEQTLPAQMESAWSVTWSRFYLPQVQTFGDYLSSYEKGREQAHLPTAEEVKRQFPNPCGYSTGMEDGAILGGAMLSVLCDRFAMTGEESLRVKAAERMQGGHGRFYAGDLGSYSHGMMSRVSGPRFRASM